MRARRIVIELDEAHTITVDAGGLDNWEAMGVIEGVRALLRARVLNQYQGFYDPAARKPAHQDAAAAKENKE